MVQVLRNRRLHLFLQGYLLLSFSEFPFTTERVTSKSMEINSVRQITNKLYLSNIVDFIFKTFLLTDTADDVFELSVQVQDVSNHSLGEVLLKWEEPVAPNGLIVTYQIEYRRVDIENVSTVCTITN